MGGTQAIQNCFENQNSIHHNGKVKFAVKWASF